MLPSISLGNMLVPSVVLLFTSEDAGIEPAISVKVVGHHGIESMSVSSDYLHLILNMILMDLCYLRF
jgi:hypothetical protein